MGIHPDLTQVMYDEGPKNPNIQSKVYTITFRTEAVASQTFTMSERRFSPPAPDSRITAYYEQLEKKKIRKTPPWAIEVKRSIRFSQLHDSSGESVTIYVLACDARLIFQDGARYKHPLIDQLTNAWKENLRLIKEAIEDSENPEVKVLHPVAELVANV